VLQRHQKKKRRRSNLYESKGFICAAQGFFWCQEPNYIEKTEKKQQLRGNRRDGELLVRAEREKGKVGREIGDATDWFLVKHVLIIS